MSEEVLTPDALTAALKHCPEWDIEGNALVRDWEFEEFMEAMDFVNLVADVAESAFHHPDITIRYTKVRLKLTTHELGGVTEADVEMAQRIDNLSDD